MCSSCERQRRADPVDHKPLAKVGDRITVIQEYPNDPDKVIARGDASRVTVNDIHTGRVTVSFNDTDGLHTVAIPPGIGGLVVVVGDALGTHAYRHDGQDHKTPFMEALGQHQEVKPPPAPAPKPDRSAHDAAAYEKALDTRQADIARRTPDDSSPWYIGSDTPAGADYTKLRSWQGARADYAQNGDEASKERMLSYVSPDNPPLAVDAAVKAPPKPVTQEHIIKACKCDVCQARRRRREDRRSVVTAVATSIGALSFAITTPNAWTTWFAWLLLSIIAWSTYIGRRL